MTNSAYKAHTNPLFKFLHKNKASKVKYQVLRDFCDPHFQQQNLKRILNLDVRNFFRHDNPKIQMLCSNSS